jgi:hypothetical protein
LAVFDRAIGDLLSDEDVRRLAWNRRAGQFLWMGGVSEGGAALRARGACYHGSVLARGNGLSRALGCLAALALVLGPLGCGGRSSLALDLAGGGAPGAGGGPADAPIVDLPIVVEASDPAAYEGPGSNPIVVAGSGQFAVVWPHLGARGWDVELSVIDATAGLAASPPVVVGQFSHGGTGLAASWDGEAFAVFWSSAPETLAMRRFDPAGNPLGDAVDALTGLGGAPDPVDALFAGGHFGLMWADYRPAGYATYYREIDREGSPAGPELRLSGDEASTVHGGLRAQGDGRLLLATRSTDGGAHAKTTVVTFDPMGASPPTEALLRDAPHVYGAGLDVDGAALDVALWDMTAPASIVLRRDAADRPVREEGRAGGTEDPRLARTGRGTLAILASRGAWSTDNPTPTGLLLEAFGLGLRAQSLALFEASAGGCVLAYDLAATESAFGAVWVEDCVGGGGGDTSLRFGRVRLP